jgi:hypothetical protein
MVSLHSPHPHMHQVQLLGKIFEFRQKDFLRQIIHNYVHKTTSHLSPGLTFCIMPMILHKFYTTIPCICNHSIACQIYLAFSNNAITFLHDVIGKRQGFFIAYSLIKLSYIYRLLFWVCPTFCAPPAPGLYGMAPKLLLRIFLKAF